MKSPKDDGIELQSATSITPVMKESSRESDSNDVVENILSQIGTGSYQLYVFVIVGLSTLAESCQLFSLSLFNYVILNVQWHRPMSDVKLTA